ncbi:hypothetical protein [Natronorubrum sp. FCH18a]|uniref:hypothetical protein n=1 Tax=Natronorubrum sp. FCH18a TaxID=3447018 RepID=UPI003F519960
MRDARLKYESLSVQPKEYICGELEWSYEFDIEVEMNTPRLREYVLFVMATESNSSYEFDSISKFCDDFTNSLIEENVPYAFESSSEKFSVEVPYKSIKESIIEFNEISEGNFSLSFAKSFIEYLEEVYVEQVGFTAEEEIPGPIVPPISQALCPKCSASLSKHLYDDRKSELWCANCEEDRPNPEKWKWQSPDPHPEYSGEVAEEQDPSQAGCPNCGSWLSIYENETIGICRNCDGIWPKGTWHSYDPVPREDAACPDCGSKLSIDSKSDFGICPGCDSAKFVSRKEWVEYDPAVDHLSYPVEVEPGVVQISEQKYRVKQTGNLVDSLWEADIDQRLAKRCQHHEREPQEFKIDGGYYFPDFRVGDIIIEVKGIQHKDMLENAIQKAESFQERNSNLTYVVIGDEATKDIPCEKWFCYPSDRFEAVQWISQNANEK